jgi:hypothetical protein
MTLNPENPTTSPGGAQGSAGQKTEQLKATTQQQATQLKGQAQGAARDVAGTARDEAVNVKDEALGQAKDLAASAKQEASSQLSTQKDRLAAGSRGISEDLDRISRGERPESDLVNQAVAMLSDRARRVTQQLESREPMDLLDDVRRFAARRPVAFLAIAAGIGLAAGRLTRGLKDAHDDDSRDLSTSARRLTPSGPAPIDRVPGTVYPEDVPATGPAGTVGTPEVLGTPAATNPYGTGVTGSGGRA